MKIAGNNKFAIYVYSEDHPPPHCHIRYGTERDISVLIPSLEPMYGAKLDKDARLFLLEHLDEICKEWESLNNSSRND